MCSRAGAVVGGCSDIKHDMRRAGTGPASGWPIFTRKHCRLGRSSGAAPQDERLGVAGGLEVVCEGGA